MLPTGHTRAIHARRQCEERTRRSNPFFRIGRFWIASLALAMTVTTNAHFALLIAGVRQLAFKTEAAPHGAMYRGGYDFVQR